MNSDTIKRRFGKVRPQHKSGGSAQASGSDRGPGGLGASKPSSLHLRPGRFVFGAAPLYFMGRRTGSADCYLGCNPSILDCNPGLQSGFQSMFPGSAAGIPSNLDCNPVFQGARLEVCMKSKIISDRGLPRSWVNLALVIPYWGPCSPNT
jgi:hypothetical protein